MKMSVKVKLLAGFVAIAGLVTLAGVMGIINVGKVGAQGDIILNEKVPQADAAMEAMIALISGRDVMGEYLLAEDINDLAAIEAEFEQTIKDFDNYADELQSIGSDEVKALTAQADTLHAKFEEAAREMMTHHQLALAQETITLSDEAKLAREYMEKVDEYSNEADLKMDQVEESAARDMAAAMAVSDATQSSSRTILLVILGVGVGVAIAIGFFLAQSISNPVLKVVKVAQAIARGDLSSEELKIKSKDEIGQLGDALNEMSVNLNDMVSQVASAASQIASSTQQLSATSEEMAAGAEEQTSQTSQVATSVEEMSATVQEVAKNAKNASDSSGEAGKTAEEGGEIVGQTVGEMQKIAKSVSDLQVVIQGLNKNSEKIGDIVGVIDDVADQTNLLALNAAIEAARAGEQGRGFAVVADEVRKLAERTTSSTKEIADMVKSIQGDTSQAVSSMEEAGKEVKEGVGVAGKAGDALKKIVEMSQGVNQIVQQIATAAEQQAAASEEISSNVESIASVSKQSASGAQQTSSAAQELSSLTDNLQSLVNQFKLRDNGSKAQVKVERAAVKQVKVEKTAPVEEAKAKKAKKKKAA